MKSNNVKLTDYFPDVEICQGVQILGIKNIRIGQGTCIGQDVWLNVCNRNETINMVIGQYVLIGRRSVVNTVGHLEIGDFTTTGPNVYIGDADHNYQGAIDKPLLTAGVTEGRSIIIEENCWIAMNSAITGNVRIGRCSVLGANSVLNHDLPPFSVAAGNPARIVRMYDPVEEKWVVIKSITDTERVLENRQRKPLLQRQEYCQMLHEKGAFKIPEIYGGGTHMHLI